MPVQGPPGRLINTAQLGLRVGLGVPPAAGGPLTMAIERKASGLRSTQRRRTRQATATYMQICVLLFAGTPVPAAPVPNITELLNECVSTMAFAENAVLSTFR